MLFLNKYIGFPLPNVLTLEERCELLQCFPRGFDACCVDELGVYCCAVNNEVGIDDGILGTGGM